MTTMHTPSEPDPGGGRPRPHETPVSTPGSAQASEPGQ
jgi:hypothetical protein